MMESNVFERTHNGEQEVSPRLYNFTIGVVLCWGFLINWLMVGSIPVESITAIDPWVFFIGYFASCFFGIYLFSNSSNPMVSFIGYNFVVVPFGLIFGVLSIDVGFSPLETMGMSLIVFGGASQIVLLQLFSGGASSLVIISSVGAVNSRHLLYGAVVSEHLSDLKLIWKIIISYFLIDQAYAISNEYLKKNKDQNRYFHLVGAGATCWVIWQSTTFLGIILGAAIPEKLGLSFAVPLTFLALLVNDFRKLINVIVIIVSGLVATVGYNYIPFKAYAIVAGLAGLLVAMILTKMVKTNE